MSDTIEEAADSRNPAHRRQFGLRLWSPGWLAGSALDRAVEVIAVEPDEVVAVRPRMRDSAAAGSLTEALRSMLGSSCRIGKPCAGRSGSPFWNRAIIAST